MKTRSGFTAGLAAPWFLAFIAVTWLASAIWPREPWIGSPGLPSWADYLLAAVFAGLAALAFARVRRSGIRLLRRELAALARGRTGGIWLNRDEHQVFAVQGKFRRRLLTITRVAEDDAQALIRKPGEGTLAMETFSITPGTADVTRHDQVMLVDAGAETVRQPPGTPSAIRSAWRLNRTAKTGFGFVIASPDQVAELIRQLRGSERVHEEEGL